MIPGDNGSKLFLALTLSLTQSLGEDYNYSYCAIVIHSNQNS